MARHCTADTDTIQGPSPAILVAWVAGESILLSSGEWYHGDWIYDPAYLAHGGEIAERCE